MVIQLREWGIMSLRVRIMCILDPRAQVGLLVCWRSAIGVKGAPGFNEGVKTLVRSHG